MAAPLDTVSDAVFRTDAGRIDLDRGMFCLLHEGLRGYQGMASGGPTDWVLAFDRSQVFVHLDRPRGEIALHGEWWFGGVWHFAPDPADPHATEVRYQVFNIAPPATRWMGTSMNVDDAHAPCLSCPVSELQRALLEERLVDRAKDRGTRRRPRCCDVVGRGPDENPASQPTEPCALLGWERRR